MPLAWKIIFAFLREIILGKTTFRQALRDHKLRVAFMIIVMISFYLNYLAIPKLYNFTAQRNRAEEGYKEEIAKLEYKLAECRARPSNTPVQNGLMKWCLEEFQKFTSIEQEQPKK